MSHSTKTSIALIFAIILTTALFFYSVRVNTPPSLKEIYNKGQNSNAAEEKPKTPTVSIADPQKGPSDAKITIVEFADFRCSHCAEINKTLNEIAAKYPQEVRLVWKDFPFLPPLDTTWQAHMAARCADRQNKFWEYHDLLLDNQTNLGAAQFLEMAKILNLNLSLFESCLNNNETKALVQKSFQEGQDIGIDGTPTLFVNGEKTNNVSLDLIEGLLIK